MAREKTAVFGIFLDFSTLRRAVKCLKRIGLHSDEISVLFRESAVSNTLSPEELPEPPAAQELEPLIGGTLGSLTYIRTDTLGVVSAALESIGVPWFDAQRHERRLRGGGVLISVRCGSLERRDSISEILARAGALDITSSSEFNPAPPISVRPDFAYAPDAARKAVN
jgi:hypothetical protein